MTFLYLDCVALNECDPGYKTGYVSSGYGLGLSFLPLHLQTSLCLWHYLPFVTEPEH
jgi:hypothetical protein